MFFAELTCLGGVTGKRVHVVVDLPFDYLPSAEKSAKSIKDTLGAQAGVIFTYHRREDCKVSEVVTVNAHGGISYTRGTPDSPALLEFIESRKKLGEVVLPQRYIVKTI